MNPETVTEAKKIVSGVKKGIRLVKKTDVVFCPPFVYLPVLSGATSTSVFLGSQNSFYERSGSFTGEVSFSQLPQFKVSHVIIGHSERRVMGEKDEAINKKVLAVVGDGMTAILCVGEKTRDAHGDYLSFVKEQIVSGLKNIEKKFLNHIVIAYEPVWAIGAKEAVASREIHEMNIFIKKVLNGIYGVPAEVVRILYGGAVNPENISDIMKNGFVQGVLVGRDSLDAKNFIEIISIFDL